MLNVMVSQTWSWFHAQLDFPKSKRIKIHVLRPNESRSYCGLQNHDDVGEMTWEQFIVLGEDACTKCRHLTKRPLDDGDSTPSQTVSPLQDILRLQADFSSAHRK